MKDYIDLIKVLGRKSFLVFAGSMVSSALAFISLFFINHYIGVDKYGTVILMTSILTSISVVADLGFASAHIKRISEGNDIHDCVSTYASIKIVLVIGYIIASFIGLILWVFVFGGSLGDSTLDIFLVILAFEVIINLASIGMVTFQATSEVAKVQLLNILNPVVRLPLIIILAFSDSSAVLLAITYMIGGLASFLASLFMLRRARFRWKRPTLFKQYLVFTMPLILINIVATVYANIDRILIGVYLGNIEVGYYSTVQTLLGVVAAIGTAVSILTFPNFSSLFAQGDIKEINKKSRIGERYISMLAFPIVIVMVIIPGQLLSTLFGPSLEAGGEVLRFLAISTFLIMINQVYSSQLLAANRPDILAKSTLIGFITGVILLPLLIPNTVFGMNVIGLGLKGAGLALLSSALIQVVIIRMAVRNISNYRFNRRLILHLISALVTGVALWGFTTFFGEIGLLHIIMMTVFSYAIFFAILTLLKEFVKEDFVYFLEIIDPKKMSKYVYSEISDKK